MNNEKDNKQGAQGKHTPGPWSWFGNTDTGEAMLATTHSGRIFVLRLGYDKSARKRPCFLVQPAGQRNGMQPLADFVQYEVCPEAGADRAHPGVYRADFREVTHPDLVLIAAAPELLEALEALLTHSEVTYTAPTCERGALATQCEFEADVTIQQARAAIAKAKGQ